MQEVLHLAATLLAAQAVDEYSAELARFGVRDRVLNNVRTDFRAQFRVSIGRGRAFFGKGIFRRIGGIGSDKAPDTPTGVNKWTGHSRSCRSAVGPMHRVAAADSVDCRSNRAESSDPVDCHGRVFGRTHCHPLGCGLLLQCAKCFALV
jgi:hypothetical protein